MRIINTTKWLDGWINQFREGATFQKVNGGLLVSGTHPIADTSYFITADLAAEVPKNAIPVYPSEQPLSVPDEYYIDHGDRLTRYKNGCAVSCRTLDNQIPSPRGIRTWVKWAKMYCPFCLNSKANCHLHVCENVKTAENL